MRPRVRRPRRHVMKGVGGIVTLGARVQRREMADGLPQRDGHGVRRRAVQGDVRGTRIARCDAVKGWAVFANEFISKGDFVVEYVGELISADEAARREALCPEAASYQFMLPSRGGDLRSA